MTKIVAWTLEEIVGYLRKVGLEVALQGNKESKITGLSTLQHGIKGTLSFLNNPKYRKYLETSQASAILVNRRNAEAVTHNAIICEETHEAWAHISKLFEEDYRSFSTIHKTAIIHESAQLEENVVVGAYAIIGENASIGKGTYIDSHVVVEKGVEIGRECYLFSHSVVRYNCRLKDRVVLHPHAVIGAEGFGFARTKKGYIKVAQIGRVILHDDVDIGSGTTVDRGAIEDTIIGRGCKIDNHVQIGHNCIIGEHTVIAGYTGIAGSVTIGNNVIIAGGVGINGHITIEDGVIVTGGTKVSHSLKEGRSYSSPAPIVETKEWLVNSARLKRLGNLFGRVKKLENQIQNMDLDKKEG